MIYALSAYIFWGLHPIYWKMLSSVPSEQIVAQRIFWSFIFFMIIISYRKGWNGFFSKVKTVEKKYKILLPALLIGSNWSLYIWAVNAGFIIETSLGYFISPLLNIFLGTFFLKEKLRPLQWMAVVIAFIGVITTTILYGQFPWIAIYLAASWALYSLMRKKSPLNSSEGLTLETAMLSIPALIYITFLSFSGTNSFFSSLSITSMLIGSGIISGLPLMIFIAGSRLINLSLIGIMQYIYPTMIFFIGAFIYHEPLNEAKLIGFIFIWIALLVYTFEGSIYIAKKKFA